MYQEQKSILESIKTVRTVVLMEETTKEEIVETLEKCDTNIKIYMSTVKNTKLEEIQTELKNAISTNEKVKSTKRSLVPDKNSLDCWNEAEKVQDQIEKAKGIVGTCVDTFKKWNGENTEAQKKIEEALISTFDKASTSITLIATSFFQILEENVLKDWKIVQTETSKNFNEKTKEHEKEAEKGQSDEEMYETQIEENKAAIFSLQSAEDTRKETQNKSVRLDQIVDIIIKLKAELEAREKFAAELKEAEDSLNEINTDIASAQHINESYDHSMAKLKKLEKSNADKRQELKDLQSKIDSFDPMLV